MDARSCRLDHLDRRCGLHLSLQKRRHLCCVARHHIWLAVRRLLPRCPLRVPTEGLSGEGSQLPNNYNRTATATKGVRPQNCPQAGQTTSAPQFELMSADGTMAAKGAAIIPQTGCKDRAGGRDRRADDVADCANDLDCRCRGVDIGGQQRNPGINGQPAALLRILPHPDQRLFDTGVRRRAGEVPLASAGDRAARLHSARRTGQDAGGHRLGDRGCNLPGVNRR